MGRQVCVGTCAVCGAEIAEEEEGYRVRGRLRCSLKCVNESLGLGRNRAAFREVVVLTGPVGANAGGPAA